MCDGRRRAMVKLEERCSRLNSEDVMDEGDWQWTGNVMVDATASVWKSKRG